MPLIFQYGSNCNLRRLNHSTRLRAGGAKNPRPALTVDEFEIAFNKWSEKNGCAAADMKEPEGRGRRIWGVVYGVSDEGLKKLANDVEGPGYEPKDISVEYADGTVETVTTFVVRKHRREDGLWTKTKYVGHIVKGLRARQVPEDYIQHVIDIAIRTNAAATDRRKAEGQAPGLENLRHGDPVS
jgi:hypothetical protein